MKALSIYQPWATMITLGPKRIENRTWAPPKSLIGKRIAIHAAKVTEGSVVVQHYELLQKLTAGSLGLPKGAILGTAIVWGYVTASTDEWFSGPIGWQLPNVRAFKDSIPCRGAQGLWTVPAEIEAQFPASANIPDLKT